MHTVTARYSGLLSALFLGVLSSGALLIITRFHTWPVFVIALLAQTFIGFVWWYANAHVVGITVRIPHALWLFMLLGGDLLFMTMQGFARIVLVAGFCIFTALAYWLWFKRYEFAPEYQRRYVQGWYKTVTTFSFFLWNASLFALFVLLQIPVWFTGSILGVIGALCGVMVLYAPKWLHGFDAAEKPTRPELFWLCVTLGLVFFQLTWALHFLPLGFLINAYSMTLIYLLILTVVDASLNERAFSKYERAFMVTICVLLFAGLANARWI